MTSIGTKFVDALVWKTIISGVALAAIGWWMISADFAAAVLLGMLVSAFNLRVVGWVSRKMVAAAKEGATGAGMWSAILLLKLFLLFVLTYVFLAVVRADVFGYIIGYSTFLLAIVWQLASGASRRDDGGLQDGDTESL
jgi:hypothetical protein